MKSVLLTLALCSVVLVAGCASTASLPTQLETVKADPVRSSDPRVKFKDGERYLRDLSATLDIPRSEICQELSQYDCVSDAFRIVLGGVEAANLAVNVPLEEAALTAPIALDRVALHVCIERVNRDMASPEKALLFRTGAFAPGAKSDKPDSGWLRATIDRIYSAILLRAPLPDETARMSRFYNEVQGDRKANDPAVASDWVTLSCFSLASSLENVFY